MRGRVEQYVSNYSTCAGDHALISILSERIIQEESVECPGDANCRRLPTVTEAQLSRVSRGLAGISGSTLVVNISGSRGAVRDGMATLGPLAVQIISQLSSLEI